MEVTKVLYTLLVDPIKADHPPIIMEADISLANLENMRGIKRRWEANGDTAIIARVTVSALDNVAPVRDSAALLLPDNDRVDELLESLAGVLLDALGEKEYQPGDTMPASVEPHLRLKVLEWVRTL